MTSRAKRQRAGKAKAKALRRAEASAEGAKAGKDDINDSGRQATKGRIEKSRRTTGAKRHRGNRRSGGSVKGNKSTAPGGAVHSTWKGSVGDAADAIREGIGSAWMTPDVIRCADNGQALDDFVVTLLDGSEKAKRLADDSIKVGTPRVLIVTGSALRAVELIRGLSSFKSETLRIGKLFARHIKVCEQEEVLKTSRMCVAVATPHRVSTLCAKSSIDLTELCTVVVDMKADHRGIPILGAKQLVDQVRFLFIAHLDAVCDKGGITLGVF